jgi:hypothetical protein
VTRFPAADQSKVENFKTGIVNSGLNIDSQGNVWVTNRFGDKLLGMAHLVDMAARMKVEGIESATDYMVRTMSKQNGSDGSVTLLRPDGTQYPGSPFTGDGLPGPWAVVVDGNDNVWISNFAMPNSPIAHLCGVRTETCPPGFKTGDQISPPGGYVGRRATDADRPRHLTLGRRVGDEQLAGHRQLLRQRQGGAVDAVRRSGSDGLLWHGQAGACAADRTGQAAIGRRS